MHLSRFQNKALRIVLFYYAREFPLISPAPLTSRGLNPMIHMQGHVHDVD
jgi:hypothetical protein